MDRTAAFTLTVVVSCLCSSVRADEAEDKAVAFIKKLGGRVVHDETLVGKPVVQVMVGGPKVTDRVEGTGRSQEPRHVRPEWHEGDGCGGEGTGERAAPVVAEPVQHEGDGCDGGCDVGHGIDRQSAERPQTGQDERQHQKSYNRFVLKGK